MTFKNKHSFISGFLGAALLIASGCVLGGCTEIADEPQGIDDAGNGTPLTIRATASGFVSCVQGDTPATRTPTENGYTTEFNDGDAIGIFALKEYATPDVTPVDGVYNLKLVYTKAADGSGSWAPASGDTHVLYNYDDDLVYVAYYPYREGITIKQDIETEIFKDLAANAKLQPAADQSTPAAYTGSDLMAAVASPTVDPANANKKVLTLKFEHLHALLVLKPMGLVNCVPPAGASFEYAGGVLRLDVTAKDATINGIKALRMDDGTFRAIVPSPAGDFVPAGSYLTKGDKTILYTGTSLTAGKLAAGKYYTQQVETAVYTDGSITRALQVGDYFCSDGKIIPGETSIIKRTYIGLVFKVGRFTADDSEYVNGNGEPMTNINGYTVALKDANNGAVIKWGNKKFALDSNRNGSSPYGYFNGFKITQLLKADGIGNYPAANACISYSPAADAKTSGWFFPAGGQMLELRNTRVELIKKTVFTNYNSGRYWQSVQNGSGDSWSVGLVSTSTAQSYISTPYYVRPIAAF